MTEQRVNEEVVNTTANVEDVLGLIDRVNETFSYGVWVPSLDKEIMFREINTSQQKRLIKSIIDSPIYNTEFIFALRDIIRENCVESIDVDKLTIFDKLMIALKMRSVSIGDNLEIEFTPDENSETTIKRGISINKIIDKVKNTIEVPKSSTLTDGSVYTIECNLPSIGTEFRLEKELRSNTNLDDIESPEELRKTIGESFVSELAKYIDTITVKSDNQATKINFSTISFRNRIAIIERLPTKLTDKIVDYINDVKSEMNKVVLIETTVKQGEETKKLEERLTIDGSFFTAS